MFACYARAWESGTWDLGCGMAIELPIDEQRIEELQVLGCRLGLWTCIPPGEPEDRVHEPVVAAFEVAALVAAKAPGLDLVTMASEAAAE